MLGDVTPQGAFERKWLLSALALNAVLLTDAPEIGPDRVRRVETWLADLARATVPVYAAKPLSEQNNHLNWAALATLAAAVAAQDAILFEWAIAATRGAIGNIDTDGSLPHELRRASKAMHYHRFALEPLILAAEIAAAAEPYVARFGDPGYAAALRAVRGKGLSSPWLGGDLTLRFGLPELPR